MTVTQDYKILTLTGTELQAVEFAIVDRISELSGLIHDAMNEGAEDEAAILRKRLAEAHAVVAKVREVRA